MIEGRNARKAVLRTVLLLLMTAAGASLLLSCGSNTVAGGPGGGGTVTPPPTGDPGGSGGTTSPPLITGHLAVADGGDNRILIYGTPLGANESASIVIGQTSFTAGLPNQGNASPSAATLDNPWGLAIDSSGNLWVADNQNCRVLEFKPPFSNGMNASLVIGQPDFNTTGPYCGKTSSGPPWPASFIGGAGSLAFDSQGDLWVVGPGRVAEYVPPFANGMAASVIIGQTGLEGNYYPCNGSVYGNHGPILPPTSATLCEPMAIAFDSQGDLWVADAGNVRILEFTPPFSTGMSASLEMIGQPPIAFEDNGTSCNDTSANGFCVPDAVAFDGSGDLWLADSSFQRVLEFVPPFSNGMGASLVVGQSNLSDAGPSRSSYLQPNGITFDGGGELIVADSDSQILVYAPPLRTGMSPKTTMPAVPNPCPTPGPAANTLCSPQGIAVLQ